MIINGGFENDFDNWNQIGTSSVSTTVLHSGNKAMKADDTASTAYSYVFQEMDFDYNHHEVIFWIYPTSPIYFSTFELIANWLDGTAIFITRVIMKDTGITFTAVNATETVSDVLTLNSWNKVSIIANTSTLTQEFYVNDILLSTLTSNSFPTIEHLLVGDLSISGMYGTAYYDDISITEVISSSSENVKQLDSQIKIYPNPGVRDINFSVGVRTNNGIHINIYNQSGQLLSEFKKMEIQPGVYDIPLGEFASAVSLKSGVYIVEFYLDNTRAIKKLIVQN